MKLTRQMLDVMLHALCEMEAGEGPQGCTADEADSLMDHLPAAKEWVQTELGKSLEIMFSDWEGFTVSGDSFCIGSGEFVCVVYVDGESVAILKEFDGGYCLEGTKNREFYYGLTARKRHTAQAEAKRVITKCIKMPWLTPTAS